MQKEQLDEILKSHELNALSDHQILRLRAAYLAERLYVSLTTGLDP